MSMTPDQTGIQEDAPPSTVRPAEPVLQALDDFETGQAQLHTVRDIFELRLVEEPALSERLIRELKTRYEKNRISLEAYLQLLTDLRRLVPEEDLATDARPREELVRNEPVSITTDSGSRLASVLSRTGGHHGPPDRQVGRAVDQPVDRAPERPADVPPPVPRNVEAAVTAWREPAPAAPLAAGPGTVLGGRFRLEERIGKGGTGHVYRARDLLVEQFDGEGATVAVKLLDPAIRRDPALLEAILKAASGMRKLRHPNIAQVHELHRFGDDYLIVMEMLEGESLARRLDRAGHPALSRREFRRMVNAVGSALDYAHGYGTVHGDIKPANVFLTTDERIKVLDFGFAGLLGPDDASASGEPRRGITLAYASCEVVQGQAPTAEDDVYSMAALMYRMLAGASPHGLRDAAEAERAGRRPARPPGLSGKEWRTLQRGLAPRRAKRLRSTLPLVEAFAEQDSRRRRWPLVAGLLLAAAAAVAWFASTERFSFDPGVLRTERTPETGPVLPPDPVPADLPSPGAVLREEPRETSPPPPPDEAPVAAADGEAPDTVPPPAVAPPIVEQPQVEQPQARPAEVREPAARGPLVVGFVPGEDPVVAESDGVVRLRVRASGGWQGPVTISIGTRDGSALLGEDYLSPTTGTVRLTAAQPSAEILIPLLSDSIVERVEDFSVVLTVEDGIAEIGDGEATVIILDDS